MANKNFNKQVAPARKKLAVGGPSSDTGKRGGMGLMGPRKPKLKSKSSKKTNKVDSAS